MTAPAHWQQRAAAHDARVADVQQRRRAEMPSVSAIVEQVRAYFPKAQVVHADEGNGRTFGKPIPVEETLGVAEVLAMLRVDGVLHPRSSRTRASELSVVSSVAAQKTGRAL